MKMTYYLKMLTFNSWWYAIRNR